ncbi:podocalyxin-like protein 2 isoform X3 [Rhineura floridana]|uniref:podocalyxin-like protein 2 isoform X3 n=1 Tax=Rhineura floridana TaxID=261503 RepID=UPI002AC7FCF4|nr:podocalyxin-like protein 2 isoform X3 [Rhineura floridana]
MQPLPRWGLRLFLAWGSLCICCALSEDPGTEGLTSTSLGDFTAMSSLESLDTSEQPNLEMSEPNLVPNALLASPGSGFSSEENEDSKVLPSQYFWDDGGDMVDSSLYVGQASDYSFPLASQKALPKQKGTQAQNPWETPTLHQPFDSLEPDSKAPSTNVLEEEEGLLPINQSKGAPQSSRTLDAFPEAPSQDSLYSILFSTTTSRMGQVTEMAADRQEEESVPEHVSSGFDLGSSMGPSLLPLFSILSATTKGPQLVSEVPAKITSESTVRAGRELEESIATKATVGTNVREMETTTTGERQKPSAGAETRQRDSIEGTVVMVVTEMATMEQAGEDLLITGSHGDGTLVTETFPRTSRRPPNPSSSMGFWDWTDNPAPTHTPIHNSTKLPIAATTTMEQSFVPHTGDIRTAVLSTGVPWSLTQVTCKDWSNLAGKNYIILNMSDNIDCEDFRVERGLQLLALMDDAFSRYENGLQGQWLISLSKPNENDKHLLMTLAGEHGVVPTNDVLLALGDMRRSLAEVRAVVANLFGPGSTF